MPCGVLKLGNIKLALNLVKRHPKNISIPFFCVPKLAEPVL